MIREFNLRSLPFLVAAMVACLLFGSANMAYGQGDIPDIPDQQQDGGNTGNANGGSDEAADGQIDAVEPTRLEFEIPDRRNQGFVGATAPGIADAGNETQSFVGPLTDEPDGEVAEGRSIGGDTNAGIGNRTATNSSVQLQENGFTIQRQSIRTRLRPAFAAPRTPSYVAERRFQSRMTRQPVVRQFGQGVTVSIANRTAVLTGVVRSNAEREIIKRQLRLEPGVYSIDDRTTNSQ